MKKLVIFASGSGTNFQCVIDAMQRGEIQASVAGLITDNPKAGAIRRAEKHHIPIALIEYSDNDHFTDDIKNQLKIWNPDLIVLAGYLKKIPSTIVDLYAGKIINIHPSLLPKYGGKGFYGIRVHKSVLDAGDDITGCTIHYVNNEYDKGDIIAQTEVPVSSLDTPETLATKVLKAEHSLLPSTIKKLINK